MIPGLFNNLGENACDVMFRHKHKIKLFWPRHYYNDNKYANYSNENNHSVNLLRYHWLHLHNYFNWMLSCKTEKCVIRFPINIVGQRRHNMPHGMPLHEIQKTCYSVTFYVMKKKDSKRCCDTTTPESIHTKDESKCGIAFAFIFGMN